MKGVCLTVLQVPELFNQIVIDIIALFLPAVTDDCCLFQRRNIQFDIQHGFISFQYGTLNHVFIPLGRVVGGKNLYFISKVDFLCCKILIYIVLDCGRYLIVKEIQSLLSFRSQMILGGVPDQFRTDEAGFLQFV